MSVNDMDDLMRHFFELEYKVAFLEKKGNEFEDFFSDIMEKLHPGDFQRTRPWGNVGDKKNDGYLRSERTLFQVYAPNEMSAAGAIAKIEEDFNGALPHWQQHFDKWVFVHNSKAGLGPDVLQTLLGLEDAHPLLAFENWGFEELRRRLFSLDKSDLVLLLGHMPSRTDMMDLGLESLIPVLEQLKRLPATPTPDLRPPPADKIELNLLSECVEALLRSGMSKADLLRRYFRTRPGLQDEIAESFSSHYKELKAANLGPDEIFGKLQTFAGGGQPQSPSTQVAVLAVLAFFFEECDIFERQSDLSGGTP